MLFQSPKNKKIDNSIINIKIDNCKQYPDYFYKFNSKIE